MKLKNIIGAAAALGLALAASPASAVDFHGYLRSGIGGNTNGGGQVCFQLPGSPFKFRLGNECETYGEIEFQQSLYKDKSGVEFTYGLMLGFNTPGAQDYEGIGGAIALRQSWVGAKNLPILPAGSMLWMGKRYYDRNDVHIIDYFYWDGSGPGVGLEGINPGVGKLSVALFQNKYGDQKQIWRPDFRWTNLPVGFGTVDVGLELYYTSDQTAAQTANRQKTSPWFTLQHQAPIFGGNNKLAVQYATGSATAMNGYPNEGMPSSATKWRIVEHLMFQPTAQVSGSFVFQYEDAKSNTASPNIYNNRTAWAVGARPAYSFNDWFKVSAEIGYQSISSKNPVDTGLAHDAATLTKLTIAPTFTPPAGPGGIFWTRPELRFFLTYAAWNKAAQANKQFAGGMFGQNACTTGGTVTGVMGCDTSGVTIGAQAESWF